VVSRPAGLVVRGQRRQAGTRHDAHGV